VSQTPRRATQSRIAGFYQKSRDERLTALSESHELDPEALAYLESGGGLPFSVADRMSENVVATFGLPLSIALNFRVNGRDVLVPMAVEEPSVVAAASNGARMVRMTGGFHGEADPSTMIAQVQFDDVPDAHAAAGRVRAKETQLLALGDQAIPRMVARGGGCRSVEVRVLDEELGILVVHMHIDVGDAMGANIVDTVAEAVAPPIHELVGGRLGLRILTNLPLGRRVRVWADVSAEAVGGAEIADGIHRASRFAELDSYRAVTHNKGFMNGLDAAAIALGQDFRSIEAAAHAFAGGAGMTEVSRYRPLATWRRTETGLAGRAELPLAVGTVGGSSRAHEGVRTAFAIARVATARDLAILLAATGLASNLAALRALAGEGIQRGHMRLHQRKLDVAPPPAMRMAGGGA